MNKTNDEEPIYPLMENAADRLRTASGRPLSEVNLDAVMEDDLSIDDIGITPETLRTQAKLARDAGYTQFGANLERAAELTAVPNTEMLQMYEKLRPGRSTYEELMLLANELENKYQALETSHLVREAAEVYRCRGLLIRS